MNNQNMAIWNANSSIDPKYTKTAKLGGRDITTFSLQSVVMMATAQFGPIGKGWGYEVESERDDVGAIITKESSYIDEKGNTIFIKEEREIVHTLIIRLWYMDDGVKVIMPVQAGHTPKLMRTSYGPKFDDEYYKKTLADAIKKSLSMLGFGADIFLGLMDDKHYIEMQQEEIAIKNESEKAGKIETLVAKVESMCKSFSENNLPLSIEAQAASYKSEIFRAFKKIGIDSTPYMAKIDQYMNKRLDQVKAEISAAKKAKLGEQNHD